MIGLVKELMMDIDHLSFNCWRKAQFELENFNFQMVKVINGLLFILKMLIIIKMRLISQI
jgi:hypothetical protein